MFTFCKKTTLRLNRNLKEKNRNYFLYSKVSENAKGSCNPLAYSLLNKNCIHIGSESISIEENFI